MTTEFIKYPKMARLSRDVVVTEKIDGTNAQILIERVGQTLVDLHPDNFVLASKVDGDTNLIMRAGSRSRYLTRQTDNFGFAKWVQEHAEELWALGEGRHFGEWWGSGIQRGYGLPKGEKRFSLFNVQRWLSQHDDGKRFACLCSNEEFAPACCHVVPILWTGPFEDMAMITHCLHKLERFGSRAAKGFMDPEGIVAYHMAGNVGFKKTVKNDETPKSKVA
jgi:hypothetical protein